VSKNFVPKFEVSGLVVNEVFPDILVIKIVRKLHQHLRGANVHVRIEKIISELNLSMLLEKFNGHNNLADAVSSMQNPQSIPSPGRNFNQLFFVILACTPQRFFKTAVRVW